VVCARSRFRTLVAMPRAVDPARARSAATGIVRALRSHGHEAYLAGGCVRDELLGLRPTDYDVATDAVPDRIAALFPRTAHVGAAFGVVLVIQDDVPVEVATFRSEGPYSDSRRPDRVKFSDARSDALRRDFTINGLFLDPLEGEPGEPGRVIDFVGGLADLAARRLRAVGNPDERLAEDHLRALRAARFAARLGFEIEPATWEAVRRHASSLRGVSRERIGQELRRMLTAPSRAEAATLVQRLGLDAPVLLEPHRGGPTPTLAALTGMPPAGVCLAAWALDRHGDALDAARVARAWRAALCLSNDETDRLRDSLTGYQALRDEFEGLGVAGQRRMLAREWTADAMGLLRARPGPDPGLPDRLAARAAELAARPPGIAPAPLVTGDDLAGAGLVPGPAFKGILDAVYDAQLEGRVRTRDEALELARALSV